MAKKFSLLLAAVAVVAFAVPAFASAAPAVTNGSGTLLSPGTAISGQSTNAVTETSLGNIECVTVRVNGELTVNSGSHVHGIGIGEGEPAECQVNGNPIPVTDITLNELDSTTQGSGTINVTFKAELPGPINCHFTSNAAPFTYTAGTTSNQLHLVESNLTGTPKACEPGLLSGDFTLTQSGGAVVLD